MILAQPTRYAGGVTLWGDNLDMRSLHDTIHNSIANGPFSEPIKDSIENEARERKCSPFELHEQYDQPKFRW